MEKLLKFSLKNGIIRIHFWNENSNDGVDQTGKVGEDSWEAIRRCQGEMMN